MVLLTYFITNISDNFTHFNNKLLLWRIMKMSHIHKYKLDSDMKNMHKHRIIGYTEKIIGINSFHFHSFYGISSYSNHTHYFSGITGLPIKTENGHIHHIEGVLEANAQHEHSFSGQTSEDIEYTAKRTVNEAYI